MTHITIDQTLCQKDLLCARECPVGILTIGPDRFPMVVEQKIDGCIDCGHCQAVCPHDALTLKGIAPMSLEKSVERTVEWSSLEGLIKSRRSMRNFRREAVPPQVMDQLFDITRWAPTGGNRQLVEWIFIEKPETLKAVIDATADWAKGQERFKFLADAWEKGRDVIFRGAPHLAIAHAGNEYGSTAADCVIAATTLELAAFSRGVGACWAGFFMIACAHGHKPLLDLLELPAGHKIHAALMMGMPKHGFRRVPARRALKLKKR
jgi:nitroreductase/NAD-dependent dihydropyrimidine dehydrogenase PreA subunit